MSAMKKTNKPAAGAVFADAAAALGAGVDAIFEASGPQASDLPLDMIDVREQVRTLFDDTEENTLAGLAESIKEHGVIQAILVRPTKDGRYELVAGERRYRASKLAGKSSIPALIREIADDRLEDVQLAENIQRENLAQIDLAKKLRRDMDAAGGDMDAVAAKHHKSKPWVSKMLGLLTLPEETARLVKESITADVEVINNVKQVEKKDKAAAKKLVDDLKATRGKEDARAKSKGVRDEVKPPKSPKPAAPKATNKGTTIATQPDRRAEQPSAGKVAKGGGAVLGKVWGLIDSNKRPETILSQLDDAETEALTAALRAPFNEGRKADSTARAVLEGLRSGRFAPDGHAALILAAFLGGADAMSENDFRLDFILKSARM